MPSTATTLAAPLGRLLLSTIFLASAAGKLAAWAPPAQMIADKGLPAPDAFLSIAVVLEIVGGLMVLLGLQARWGAILLLLFLIPVSVIMHNFWAVPEAQQQEQMINFMKNVSIAGGLLMVVALGAGPMSIDNRARRKLPGVAP
jgi:putative oxidoreductase